MTEKKPKAQKLELQTRVPKKSGIFDNLGKGKQLNVRHPFSEIINFPADDSSEENTRISDVRGSKSKTPEGENFGHPSKEKSEVSFLEVRTSGQETLGHPNVIISDIKTPENDSRVSENIDFSDTKTSEKSQSDTRDEVKRQRRGYDASYEQKRKENNSIDRMNLRPHIEIGKRIRVFCAQESLELTEFFQLAAINYIENFGHPSSLNSDIKTPLDDRRLMIYKTKPSIINLYLQYNLVFNEKSKWTVRDDEAAFKFNDSNIHLIELGFIQTQSNKNFTGKINSFSYYTNEIQNFIELNMPEEGIEMMLKINRQRWERATGKTISQNK